MTKPARQGKPSGPAARRVRKVFAECGFVRRPSAALIRQYGVYYHKGWEVRFVVNSAREAFELACLVNKSGLKPGTPYPKRTQFVLPVYGRAAVEWLAPDKAFVTGAPRPTRKSVARISSGP